MNTYNTRKKTSKYIRSLTRLASITPRYLLFAGILVLSGCGLGQKEVTLYTTLNPEITEPIFKQFTAETGITVLPVYPAGATNTGSLVNRIISEKDNPQCDVFWNDDMVSTIRLKNKGLLAPTKPKHADLYPDAVKDPERTWYGFAALARVLIVNTNILKEEQWPQRIQDLAKRQVRAKTTMDTPLRGTTAAHMVCLFAFLGESEATNYLQKLKANQIVIQHPKKSCAEQVAKGNFYSGLADSDDAFIEINKGNPVTFVFPDDHPKSFGTLFIPGSVAMIKGAPHKRVAKKLINFLLAPTTEEQLAQSPAALFPLNKTYQGPHPFGPMPNKRMQVDFVQATAEYEKAENWVRNDFLK